MQEEAVAIHRLSEEGKEGFTISSGSKDGLPFVASCRDVIQRPGILQSQWSGHDRLAMR
jgi:hypothetical protein